MVSPIYDYRNKNSKRSDKFIKELNELIDKNEAANKIEFNFNGYKCTLEKDNNELIFKISDGKETAILPGDYFKTFANQFNEKFRSLVKEQVEAYVKVQNDEIQNYEVIDDNIKIVDDAIELHRTEISKDNLEKNKIERTKELFDKNLSLKDIEKIFVENIDKNSRFSQQNDSIVYSNSEGNLKLMFTEDNYKIKESANLSDDFCNFVLDTINKNINCLNVIDEKIAEYSSDEKNIDYNNEINISR